MREQITFAGIGLLSVVVGLPLARRRIRPNRWYGLRIPATFADEHVWYEANAVTGRDLTLSGGALLLLALALAPVAVASPVIYVAVCGGVFVAGSVASTVRGCRLANRLLRERRAGDGSATARRGGPGR